MKKNSLILLMVCGILLALCDYSFAYSTWTGSINGSTRSFRYEAPSGTVPGEGWPVIILFHGAALTSNEWYSCPWLDCGGKNFRISALAARYFIIAPDAIKYIDEEHPGLGLRWDTTNGDITQNNDLMFIETILNMINQNAIGANQISFNSSRIYCTGFSNGATMTRLVAYIFPDNIAAVSTNSSCGCDNYPIDCDYDFSIPLPDNHPPIQFKHGFTDLICDYFTDYYYYTYLNTNGVTTEWLWNGLGHVWLSEFDDDVLNWFSTY